MCAYITTFCLQGSWSSATKSKQQTWPVPHTPPSQPQAKRERASSFNNEFENEDDDEMSFWEECALEARNNPAPSTASGKHKGSQKKSSNREEVSTLYCVC